MKMHRFLLPFLGLQSLNQHIHVVEHGIERLRQLQNLASKLVLRRPDFQIVSDNRLHLILQMG